MGIKLIISGIISLFLAIFISPLIEKPLWGVVFDLAKTTQMPIWWVVMLHIIIFVGGLVGVYVILAKLFGD